MYVFERSTLNQFLHSTRVVADRGFTRRMDGGDLLFVQFVKN